MYEYVLNAINNSEIPEKMKVRLIGRLSLELNKLSIEQLIKFINMCKKDIENANENCMQRYNILLLFIYFLSTYCYIFQFKLEGTDSADIKNSI